MKNALRKELLAKRNKLSKEDIIKKSIMIKELLQDLKEYKNAKNICLYASFQTEVHTLNLIKEALVNKNIIIPKVDTKRKRLILSELRDYNDLEPGYYNILEPKTIREKTPLDLDLIIIPGIAFDKEGFRLGYGMGFYDRMLEEVSIPKIGLAFEEQIIDSLPYEEHDVAMDIIVTDKGIIRI